MTACINNWIKTFPGDHKQTQQKSRHASNVCHTMCTHDLTAGVSHKYKSGNLQLMSKYMCMCYVILICVQVLDYVKCTK